MNHLSDGSIAYSQDGGVTWTTTSEIATLGNPVVSALGQNVLTVNSRGMTQVYVASFEETSAYSGRLSTFDLENIGFLAAYFRPHPYDPNAVLALGSAPVCRTNAASPECIYSAYFSTNFGRTWETIVTYAAGMLDWAPSAYNSTTRSHEVIVEDYQTKTGNGSPRHRPLGSKRLSIASLEVQYSGQPKAAVTLQPLQESVFGSLVWSGVIFATKARNPARPTTTDINLLTSHDNGRSFKLARLPKSANVSSTAESSYAILDVSKDGAVFVNVRFNSWEYGYLYSSDADGDNYALNLRYAARDLFGGVDFGIVAGIEGVYLANQELTPNTPGAELFSRITYDNGGEWFPLSPPESEIADCGVPAEQCFLHLRRQVQAWKPNFFTTPSDVGLIIGTGNVGSKLLTSASFNTYLSNSAGKTWTKAFEGRYGFEVSQNGGILIASREDTQTSTLKWSSDSGRSWKECLLPPLEPAANRDAEAMASSLLVDEYANHDWTVMPESLSSSGLKIARQSPLQATQTSQSEMKRDATAVNVAGLTSVPSADSSARFIITARTPAGSGFIYMDFNATEERTCQGWDDLQSPTSDYEPFSPSDKDGDGCILGRKIVYARKKPTASCWVAHTVEPRILFEFACQCSRQDYMCDYCFAPNATSPDQCIPDCVDFNPALPPANCVGQYRRTSGYRLVAGDRCKGGVNMLGPMEQCPTTPVQTQPVSPPIYTPPLSPPVPVSPVPVAVPTTTAPVAPPKPNGPQPTAKPPQQAAPVVSSPIHHPSDSPSAAPSQQRSKIVLPAIISSMTIVLMLGVLATLFFLSARNARVRHGLLRCVPDSWLPAYMPPDREGGAHYHPLQGTGLSATAHDDIFNDDEFLQEDANVLEMDDDE